MSTQQGSSVPPPSSSASTAPAPSASTSSSRPQAHAQAAAIATPQSSPGPGSASAATGSASRKNKRAERVAARAAGGAGGDAAAAGSSEPATPTANVAGAGASAQPKFKPDGTPILSKAERKAKQAAEAAAAAAAGAGGSATGSGTGGAVNGSSVGTASQRARDPSISAHTPGKAAGAHQDPSKSLSTHPAAAALFGNVSLPQTTSQQFTSLITSVHKRAVHPSILLLSSLLASKQLTGANARAMAVLLALRDFIAQYRTPVGATLTRDLVTKLGVQIGHLKEARPLGTSVGHAIRYLKYEISVTDKDWDEQTAKAHLLSRIDHFIRDRITYAGRVIQSHVALKIQPNSTVLTYARSSIVESTLLALHRAGTVPFSVICIDSGQPLHEGRALLATLSRAGIPCTFGPLSALSTLMPRADLVLLGTASLLANGALYSRAGTSLVAMAAKELGKPVIVECETYKFSDRIQLDSFAGNEAGAFDDLLLQDCFGEEGAEDEAGEMGANSSSGGALYSASGSGGRSGSGNASEEMKGPLTRSEAIKLRPHLQAVNLMYDITPPGFITAVASEVGLSGPESVGVILRDYKSVLFGV